jgi:hypothetical protein
MALRGGWLRRFLPLTVSAVAESSTGERRLGLSVAWDDDEAGCQKLEAVFPTRSPAPSFHLGSEAEPVEIWTWSRAAGASVYTATGFNSRKQLAKRPEATARVSTTRHSVELTATPPAGTSQVLFLVSGCIDGENYLSATTYADIEWPQALAAKGGNP